MQQEPIECPFCFSRMTVPNGQDAEGEIMFCLDCQGDFYAETGEPAFPDVSYFDAEGYGNKDITEDLGYDDDSE